MTTTEGSRASGVVEERGREIGDEREDRSSDAVRLQGSGGRSVSSAESSAGTSRVATAYTRDGSTSP